MDPWGGGVGSTTAAVTGASDGAALHPCALADVFMQRVVRGDRPGYVADPFGSTPAVLLQEGCDERVAGGEGNGGADQDGGEAVHVLLPLVADFVLLKVTLAVTVAK